MLAILQYELRHVEGLAFAHFSFANFPKDPEARRYQYRGLDCLVT
jgi:hypothetical protein